MRHIWDLSAIVTVLSLAPPMWAQSSTGEIDVNVTDATAATVMDARVTITGSETGALVRDYRCARRGRDSIHHHLRGRRDERGGGEIQRRHPPGPDSVGINRRGVVNERVIQRKE